MQDTGRNDPEPCKSKCVCTEKGKAWRRKYKRLKLDGGQAYDLSAD
jgi:hypothetical protein